MKQKRRPEGTEERRRSGCGIGTSVIPPEDRMHREFGLDQDLDTVDPSPIGAPRERKEWILCVEDRLYTR
ncbi:hypothetical protein DAI22_01g369850 [Oryza sativa Japonica Group]|nr:hypothetical protein DAI22_01g369850 [Oryza sativa Japonica Group]